MSQAAFLVELTQRSVCGLLLSVTNLLISRHNYDSPVASWLATLPCVLAWERNLPPWSLLAAEVDCVRTLQGEPFMPAYVAEE
jgi:uncharacterized protein (UPF0276 family)